MVAIVQVNRNLRVHAGQSRLAPNVAGLDPTSLATGGSDPWPFTISSSVSMGKSHAGPDDGRWAVDKALESLKSVGWALCSGCVMLTSRGP